MLKHIFRNVHPHEIEIGQYFPQEPLLSHPKNHCIPVLDVLDIPNTDNEAILVMPLFREYDNPRLKSVGEAVEYFRQVFEVREDFKIWISLSRIHDDSRVCSLCTSVMSPIGKAVNH